MMETEKELKSHDQIKYFKAVKKIEPRLIIKPKNQYQTSTIMKSDIIEKINPADITVAINKIKPMSQCSVLIQGLRISLKSKYQK